MSSSLVVVEALPFYRNAAKFACYAARIEFQTMKGRKSGSRVPNSQFHLPVLRQPGRTLGRVLREHLPPGSPLRRVGRLICHSVRRHLRWVNDNAGPERRGLHVYFDVWVHQRPEKRGRSEVRITSSYDATQLWFNQTFAEFVDFRSKLAANTSPVKSISTTTVLSQSTGPSEFQSGAVIVSTLSDVFEVVEAGCNKKLSDDEGFLKCSKCKGQFVEGTVRYKLLVRVVDRTGDAPFLLWDREVAELVCVRIPPELEILSRMAMIFKIGFKKGTMRGPNSAYNVIRVLRDQLLLDTYCSNLRDHQDKDLMSKMIEED
nr:uncharacterized protein LOC109179507 [Ipomoea trifida]